MKDPPPNARANAGFTSVELAVAMVAAGILILASGTMLFYGYRAWEEHLLAGDVRRDAVHTLDQFARDVRAARRSDISLDNDTIRVATEEGTAILAATNGAVVYYPDGGGGITLVPVSDEITDVAFSFTTNERSIALSLTLSIKDQDMSFQRTATWRNGR